MGRLANNRWSVIPQVCGVAKLAACIVMLVCASLMVEVHLAQALDTRIVTPTEVIISYLEGSFGALGMTLCGSVAIVSLVLGVARKSRRASLVGLTFLLLAVAFFLLRAGISYFFNDIGIRQ